MTVVETDRFLADAAQFWTAPEREELVLYLAQSPEAGQIIPGTGGVRKLRWSMPGMGKRSGARVIYYFHSTRLPLFLLAAYGKSEKANLTQAERNAMKRIVPLIVTTYSIAKE